MCRRQSTPLPLCWASKGTWPISTRTDLWNGTKSCTSCETKSSTVARRRISGLGGIDMASNTLASDSGEHIGITSGITLGMSGLFQKVTLSRHFHPSYLTFIVSLENNQSPETETNSPDAFLVSSPGLHPPKILTYKHNTFPNTSTLTLHLLLLHLQIFVFANPENLNSIEHCRFIVNLYHRNI